MATAGGGAASAIVHAHVTAARAATPILLPARLGRHESPRSSIRVARCIAAPSVCLRRVGPRHRGPLHRLNLGADLLRGAVPRPARSYVVATYGRGGAVTARAGPRRRSEQA